MFDLVRNHKRWMLFLVLILILPSFVFFGIEGYARFVESDKALATVDGASISRAEYDAARRNQLDRARQMLGAGFDPLFFDTPAMRRQTLEQLIDARVLAAATADGHFAVSDHALRGAIARIPALQKDGRFDSETYTQLLAAQGISTAQFEASVRYDLAQAQVLQPVEESGLAPRLLVAALLSAMTQERSVQLRRFDATDFVAAVELDDADVKRYYEANTAQFHVPEKIDAQYIVLDSAAVLKDVTVSDDELAAYYEQNKRRFTNEERRVVSHILIERGDNPEAARSKAEELARQASADPSSFAGLARENSDDAGSAADGGSLGEITRGTFVPALEDAVFALKQGEVSGVVESDFGFHVLKIDQLREQSIKPLDEVRDQLAEEVRMQKAGARFGEAAGQLTNLVYDFTDSLQPAADALNLPVQEAKGIAREAGAEASGAAASGIFSDGRVRQALFSSEVMREARNSGVIELAPDRLVAVRAQNVVPAHTAPFETVADEIRQRLTEDKALGAAQQAGEAMLAELRQGAAAQGFGDTQTVSRSSSELSATVLRAVMGVADDAAMPAYVGARDDEGYVVARIDSIRAGEAPAEDIVKAEIEALGQALGQEHAQAYLTALRKHYEVVIEPYAEQVMAEDANS